MGSSLTTAELARRWGMNPVTLRGWRRDGKGPAFFRPSGNQRGKVLYRLGDVQKWEREQK